MCLIPLRVNAEDKYSKDETWIECIYNIGTAATYNYYYNLTNNTFTPVASPLVTHLNVVSNLKSSDFVDKTNNQLYCPNIYVAVSSNSAGATYSARAEKEGNAQLYKVTTEKKNIVASNQNNSITKKHCVYGNVSFTLDMTNKKVLSAEIPNYVISSFQHSFSDIYDENKKECKCVQINSVCTDRGGSYCSIYKSGKEVCYEGYVEEETQTPNTSTSITEKEKIDFKFCEEDGVLKTFQIVSYLIMIIKILVPLLLIIFGSIDLGKAVIAGDDKAIQAASKMLVTRAIGGIIIFFIPTIINFAVGLVASWSSVKNEFINCQTCLNSASECITKRKEICSKEYTDKTCTWDDQLGSCNCDDK